MAGLVLRVLAVGAAVVASGPAAAQSINQFVGFGDSTIDSGWYRNNIVGGVPFAGGGATFNALFPTAVAEGAGRATSSPGLVSSEVLAGYFGASAIPANQAGGTNYATSGARNNETNGPGDGLFQEAVPTSTQISNYLAAHGGVANPNALYLISSGGNNVAWAIDNLAPANRAAYVIDAANDQVDSIASLKAAGARYIIVPNLPQSFGGAAAQSLRTTYNDTLWNGLAAEGVNFIPADFNSLRQAIVANPAAFGFQFVTNAPAERACTPVVDAAALLCSTSVAPLVAPNADQTRLFADESHFATAGQKIVADYYYSLVIAPSQISLLAENPVKTRAAVIALIENQIPISQRVRGPLGFNVWAAGDVSSLKIDPPIGFVGESATPAMVTVGIDTVTSTGLLVGLAVSAGTKKPNFSLGGGYTQDEFAVSGYAASVMGPVWFNMIGSFGALHYDINRVVPLGITLQQNNATTDGTNASFATRVGHNTVSGPITHGPVVGVTLQLVHVNAFTETGSVTSLGFADQTRHSAVGVIGYQASLDAGMFRPFARVLWNHEFAATDRSVTASLTSTVAPSYSLPAVELGKDWASATAGVAVTLGPGVTGLLSATGQLGQDQVKTYGGQLGVNVAF